MRRAIIYSMWILLIISCINPTNKDDYFNEIDYTYDSGWKDAFSIKIFQNGNYILGVGRWNITYYRGNLYPSEIRELDSLIRNNNFSVFDSTYYEDKVDQASFKYIILNSNKKDSIQSFVYGNAGPSVLYTFSNTIKKIKDRIPLVKHIDTIVYFRSRAGFYPMQMW